MDKIFSPPGFMPHRSCLLWALPLLGLYVIRDAFITLGHYTIPRVLIFLAFKGFTAVTSNIPAFLVWHVIPKALAQRSKGLIKANTELTWIHHLAIGREEWMIQLRHQIHQLARELGKKPYYHLSGIRWDFA